MTSAAPRPRPPAGDPVLVTGADGLVGRAVVERLLVEGWAVVASDLDSPGFRRWSRGLAERYGERGLFRADPADLTDAVAVRHLVWSARPGAVVHLAAVIPPGCYLRPDRARRVNVGGTAHLLEALAGASGSPRLVLASSIAVHGARNPHRRGQGLLDAATPTAPADLYGQHKVEAEALVRGFAGAWVVLRLGGVLTPEPHGGLDTADLDFEGMLPTDQRIQTVDVRDVARAFVAAATLPVDAVAGRTLLIGGDASHRRLQGDITPALTAAMGLEDAVPPGRPGDPEDDAAWFVTDWMDTDEAQAVLDFQRVGWEDLLADVRARAGRRRYLLRLIAPVLHEVLGRRPARRRALERAVADPWGDVAATFGSPREH